MLDNLVAFIRQIIFFKKIVKICLPNDNYKLNTQLHETNEL